MLATMPMPSTTDLIDLFLTKLGASGFGTVRTTVGAEKAVQYEETEIVLRRDEQEAPRDFLRRALAEAEEGDQIEWQWANRKPTVARITRRDQLPLRYEPGDSFETIYERFKLFLAEQERAA